MIFIEFFLAKIEEIFGFGQKLAENCHLDMNIFEIKAKITFEYFRNHFVSSNFHFFVVRWRSGRYVKYANSTAFSGC